MRMKRQKMDEGLVHSKTFNGFFKYNTLNPKWCYILFYYYYQSNEAVPDFGAHRCL